MFKNSPYHTAIRKEMERLSKNPKVIFLGQCIRSETFYGTLENIPGHQLREFPVCEDLQLGISIGLALEGFLPVSIFQRMDFLPRAMDQLVNHLNLIPKISRRTYNPKIIIRVTVGNENTGLQHNKNLTNLMKVAVDFPVLEALDVEDVHYAYSLARKIDTSIMIIEHNELYTEK